MKIPVTPATRLLKNEKVDYKVHFYAYEEKGGTSASARLLNVPESSVVKTLVFKDDQKHPLLVLMTGDKKVSTKTLARLTGAKHINPCEAKEAQKHSGYLVGGTSPFATRKKMPIYLEKCVLDLDILYINGGKRGFLVSLSSADLVRILKPEIVEVGLT